MQKLTKAISIPLSMIVVRDLSRTGTYIVWTYQSSDLNLEDAGLGSFRWRPKFKGGLKTQSSISYQIGQSIKNAALIVDSRKVR